MPPYAQSHLPSISQLYKMFHSSPDLICILDLEGRFRSVSAAALQVLGYRPEELLGKPFIDLVVENDRAGAAAAMERLMHGSRGVGYENRYCRKDGTLVPLSWAATWDAEEQLAYCIARDLTEQKAQEAAFEAELKSQHRKTLEIMERIQDGFFAMDQQWRINYVNPFVETMLNIRSEDYLGRNYWECFPGLVGTVWFDQYHHCLELQQPVHFEEYFPPFEKWLSVDVYPSETGLSIFFRDVTEKRRMEEEMTTLSLIAKKTYNTILITSADHTITWVNEAFTRTTGYRLEEVVGKMPSEFFYVPQTEHAALSQIRERRGKEQGFKVWSLSSLTSRMKSAGLSWRASL